MKIGDYIDHTLLKPEATTDHVRSLCREARDYGLHAVCVNPLHIPLVGRELAGSRVLACAVIGFPLGACPPAVKAFEAQDAIAHGARELDMVIDIGALVEGRLAAVEADIRAVVQAAQGRALVKAIIECALLDDRQKVQACECALAAGAAFVKTSTGFGPGGASADDVRLLRATVGQRAGVKAAGGIRDYHSALGLIEAGASRIGTSAGVAIVRQARDLAGGS